MEESRGLWRGKRLNNGEWALGCLIRDSSKAMIVVLDDKTNRMSGTAVDPSTLGECTGLTDKNGQLIFEGDIIDHRGERYVIKYLEKYMRFSPTNHRAIFSVFDYTQSKIIGNIHDNPELLKRATGEDIGNAAQDTIMPAT